MRSLLHRWVLCGHEVLSLGALHILIRLRLRRTFPRPVLGRLHEISGRNPFYALELAPALGRRGGIASLEPHPPVPRSLHALVEERLSALPEQSHEMLVHAAALAEPSVLLLDAALDADAKVQLRPAVEAQVVELDGG